MQAVVWVTGTVLGTALERTRLMGAIGETLLSVCEAGGIPIDASCGGFAACNSCRVAVVVGAENLSPCSDEEAPFLDAADHRLACQALVLGDLEIRLAPGA